MQKLSWILAGVLLIMVCSVFSHEVGDTGSVEIHYPLDGRFIEGDYTEITADIQVDNFRSYSVFISEESLTEVPILEDALDDHDLQKPYSLISQASVKPRTSLVALLRTSYFDSGTYKIWVVAQDQPQNTFFDHVLIRVDNDAPRAALSPINKDDIEVLDSPKDDFQVRLSIKADVSDYHLDGFSLSTLKLPSGADEDWTMVMRQDDLYLDETEVADRRKGSVARTRGPYGEIVVRYIASLFEFGTKQGEVKRSLRKSIDFLYEISILEKTRIIKVKLDAWDQAGNRSSQQISIKAPLLIYKEKGGVITSLDEKAHLEIPAYAFASHFRQSAELNSTYTEVLRNEFLSVARASEAEFGLPLPGRRISPIFKISPIRLQLEAHKPAKLTITYDPLLISPGMRPIIFHRWNLDQSWNPVGATPSLDGSSVATNVVFMGHYTVGEIPKIKGVANAKLVKDTLICQPRVFSPNGGGVHSQTNILFQLDQPAIVTIKVYDVSGRLVRLISKGQTFSRGRQAVSWQGRNYNGEVVPVGLYIVTVTVSGQTQTKMVNVWNR